MNDYLLSAPNNNAGFTTWQLKLFCPICVFKFFLFVTLSFYAPPPFFRAMTRKYLLLA